MPIHVLFFSSGILGNMNMQILWLRYHHAIQPQPWSMLECLSPNCYQNGYCRSCVVRLLRDEQLKAFCTFVEGRDVFFIHANWLWKKYMLLQLVFDCLRLESDNRLQVNSCFAVSPPIALIEDQVASLTLPEWTDMDTKACVSEGAYFLKHWFLTVGGETCLTLCQ